MKSARGTSSTKKGRKKNQRRDSLEKRQTLRDEVYLVAAFSSFISENPSLHSYADFIRYRMVQHFGISIPEAEEWLQEALKRVEEAGNKGWFPGMTMILSDVEDMDCPALLNCIQPHRLTGTTLQGYSWRAETQQVCMGFLDELPDDDEPFVPESVEVHLCWLVETRIDKLGKTSHIGRRLPEIEVGEDDAASREYFWRQAEALLYYFVSEPGRSKIRAELRELVQRPSLADVSNAGNPTFLMLSNRWRNVGRD